MTHQTAVFVAHEQDIRQDDAFRTDHLGNSKNGYSCVEAAEFKPSSSRTPRALQHAKDADEQKISGERHKKVTALKHAIQNGTYHVSAEALADKLIESLLR